MEQTSKRKSKILLMLTFFFTFSTIRSSFRKNGMISMFIFGGLFFAARLATATSSTSIGARAVPGSGTTVGSTAAVGVPAVLRPCSHTRPFLCPRTRNSTLPSSLTDKRMSQSEKELEEELKVKYFSSGNFFTSNYENIRSFIRANYIPRAEIERLITEEINIAHLESQPTSRLTSLFNKLNSLLTKHQ